MNQIRTDRIVRVYSGRKVVNEVSITVNKGEVVGLLGPNGAGKTTSFYMIVGLIKPTKGRIFGDDRDITSLPMYRRARVGIGYLPQEASVFRKLSVEDNIMAILESLKIPDHDRRERLEQLLEDFNITAVRKSLAYTLSGGERRRTEIARSLATTPDFMLLDEPFAGIDPIAVEDIQSIISGLRQKGLGVLITDHNVRDTLAITDRAYIICEGQILKEGTAEFLANDPEARKIYLGTNFKLD
ncbi:MAG: LPS export ABC transporter ATP-binding protein [Candidatus Raymondbacteria bacterium RifOxyA12_full_50_37]|uniref:LPS export ABC transporter ATP-binding protein n=1 Tax=Candidatus Raymondbacteria bacterium RIFOXYD12_FULL_49_13 TaxID=1817890 RepID=A0A1F7FBF9_UNCRA|nr:MAG: LPS export ABC transporter ATP-binding protein [Candidatus Raymondbacteria bacterium RifOxyA12_full_50_37]OGJ92540.1 MAG: LPS export ABC transporter ATP-binding protein [Candidatus Raymondbacteria bacterium RIFOXYA2_FULL_49_16]OGJ97894.1 MAG: LPS export ABC transporter ATP-binding protein [Candidatus Raymondbacteria bacterium RIFOXYC2_FULL_50_21]OGK03827.1 MAG: LPS export ABC transporter ATP-binding protein [Candidatus Raymondbacteria bacterium RIFOXYD12_FULL_49_13]OGK07853.1 MAG: LPS e